MITQKEILSYFRDCSAVCNQHGKNSLESEFPVIGEKYYGTAKCLYCLLNAFNGTGGRIDHKGIQFIWLSPEEREADWGYGYLIHSNQREFSYEGRCNVTPHGNPYDGGCACLGSMHYHNLSL